MGLKKIVGSPVLLATLSFVVGGSLLLDLAGRTTSHTQSQWICRISYRLQNDQRHVQSAPNVECGGIHSAPFGNWGVDSNMMSRIDGHQFDGWCHNPPHWYHDCSSSWYQWNSCRNYRAAPDCIYYNAPDCSSQQTTTGVNNHAWGLLYDHPVSEPNEEGGGGCADLAGLPFVFYNNFMRLYELDPATPDGFVQTLFFPDAEAAFQCDNGPYYCYGEGQWHPLTGRDPSAVHDVTAVLRVAILGELYPPPPDP